MGLKRLTERLLTPNLVLPGLVLPGLMLLACRPGWAQDDLKVPTREQRLSDPVYMSWVSYEPVGRCVSCHVLGPSEAEIDSGRSGELTSFSRQREMLYWLLEDKHTIARRRVEPFAREQSEEELNKLYDRLDKQIESALAAYRRRGDNVNRSHVGLKRVPEEWIGESNILSRRICDKLWGKGSITTADGYAKFRDNCLTCHGGYQPGATGFDLADLDEARLGIDCLYCHQKGDNDEWIAPHQLPDKWRLLPPETKEASGLRNLVRTSNQADLCFDCHVGNRSKNMFVSHEMYAAGHPPIPSIELHKFCDAMPQHWQTPSTLYEALRGEQGRDEYFAVNYPGVVKSIDAGKVYWNTRKMLIGALTARRKAIDLLADSAAAHPWADYSLYDCAACHHELHSDSLRQRRGFPGAPGRPRQHEWPDALLSILYEESNLAQSGLLERQLKQHFGDHPFGDPQAVGPTAMLLRDQIDIAVKDLESKPVTDRVAMKLLQKLMETPAAQLVTYDSARQVVWAMNTIVEELVDEGAPINPAIVAAVQRLGEFETAGIEAELPSGRNRFIYPKQLESDLQRRANFDPGRLAEKLAEIRQMPVRAP